jgi:hypothetical protein
MRPAGTQLLVRAQEWRMARVDLCGTDLFALPGALAGIRPRARSAARIFLMSSPAAS